MYYSPFWKRTYIWGNQFGIPVLTIDKGWSTTWLTWFADYHLDPVVRTHTPTGGRSSIGMRSLFAVMDESQLLDIQRQVYRLYHGLSLTDMHALKIHLTKRQRVEAAIARANTALSAAYHDIEEAAETLRQLRQQNDRNLIGVQPEPVNDTGVDEYNPITPLNRALQAVLDCKDGMIVSSLQRTKRKSND